MIFEVRRACVRQRKGPSTSLCVCPVDRLAEVGLQMHNRALAASIGEFHIICPINHVEHDRTRAEIKRHAIANEQAGVTVKAISQSAPLDVGHADGCSRPRPALKLRIAPERAVRDNRRQPVDMDDVIIFGSAGGTTISLRPPLALPRNRAQLPHQPREDRPRVARPPPRARPACRSQHRQPGRVRYSRSRSICLSVRSTSN